MREACAPAGEFGVPGVHARGRAWRMRWRARTAQNTVAASGKSEGEVNALHSLGRGTHAVGRALFAYNLESLAGAQGRYRLRKTALDTTCSLSSCPCLLGSPSQCSPRARWALLHSVHLAHDDTPRYRVPRIGHTNGLRHTTVCCTKIIKELRCACFFTGTFSPPCVSIHRRIIKTRSTHYTARYTPL